MNEKQHKNIDELTENRSNEVNIQPSEPETDSSHNEENAPGRTAGKAEGSREIIEEDLAEKEHAQQK